MYMCVWVQGYMVELTSHQGSVGRVLKAGSVLLSGGQLTDDEEREVREQMNLLNSRWEHLRVSSMERQSRWSHVCMISLYLARNINRKNKTYAIYKSLYN